MASGFLDKERIVAGPGFNRWLVPPAALAIHLCIGMAYGFSVFWLPLSKALGIKDAVKCGPEVGFFQELFTTTCDWKIASARLDVHAVLRLPRRLGRAVGRLARARRPAQGRCGLGDVLVRRHAALGRSASTCTSSG